MNVDSEVRRGTEEAFARVKHRTDLAVGKITVQLDDMLAQQNHLFERLKEVDRQLAALADINQLGNFSFVIIRANGTRVRITTTRRIE